MKPTDALRALLAVVSLFSVLAAFAQSSNGTVSGIVVDDDGRVIAGADIVGVNDATAVRYFGHTNNEGIYSIPNLPPGHYRIQISKRGFKTLIKPDIVLNTQSVLAINFALPVGATIEAVTVEGGAPLIQTESATVSTVIDREFVSNLPLNGRSFNTLMQLTPGVVIAQQPSGTAGGSAPGQFSIGGQRTDANSFMVDGVSANFGVSANGVFSGASGTGSSQAFSALGGTSSLVSAEALQEFRIETSSFAPEFGRTPGGQVLLTTRSGTNRFTGQAYEYFRNDKMDANDWFANRAGRPRAAERHNDFGGIVGGPIFRSKTFFFFSYEGARLRLPQTSLIQAPYLNDTNCRPSPAIRPYLDVYPKPNGTISQTACTGQFTGSYSNSATLNATALRLDHNLSNRVSVFARYNYAPSLTSSRVYALSSVQDGTVKTQTGTVGLNILIARSAANNLRFNFSSQTANSFQRLDSFGGAVPIDQSLILGGSARPDAFGSFQTSDTNYFSIGPVASNQTRQINVVDDFNVVVKNHQLKFGVDYRGIYLDRLPHSTTISLTSSSVNNLIATGRATQLSGVVNAPASFLTKSNSIYAQDTWKVTRRVTLTYGARWELAPAPTPLGDTRAAAWQNTTDPARIALAPFGTPLWQTTYGNIAPRFGLAWMPTQDGATVLRAGFGVFYDLGVGRAADVSSFFPGQASASFQNVSLPVASASTYLPSFSLNPPYPNVTAFSPDLKLPRSYQWNLALERAFPGRQVLTATYVGQWGSDVLRQTAAYRPNPSFSSAFILTSNTAWSTYNALQVQYKVPVNHGLQAIANYTLSHSLDNASNDVVAGLTDSIISTASDYASSDYDVRNIFSGALTYTVSSTIGRGLRGALARSWSVSSVVVARNGFPFNGRVLSLSSVTGGYAYSRPDRVLSQPVWIPNSQAGGGKMLNAAAFVQPTSLRQGTESRNDIAGFGLAQVDLSLARSFPVHDRLGLTMRVDAFNLLNHPNFANPSALIGLAATNLQSAQMLNSALGGLNPLFQQGGSRSLQLSLKLQF